VLTDSLSSFCSCGWPWRTCNNAVERRILNPSRGIEFAVSCLDLVQSVLQPIRNVCLRGDFEDVDALDLLRLLLRNPSEENMVASVPNIQDREWNVRLSPLESNVLSLGAECETPELESSSAMRNMSRGI